MPIAINSLFRKETLLSVVAAFRTNKKKVIPNMTLGSNWRYRQRKKLEIATKVIKEACFSFMKNNLSY